MFTFCFLCDIKYQLYVQYNSEDRSKNGTNKFWSK